MHSLVFRNSALFTLLGAVPVTLPQTGHNQGHLFQTTRYKIGMSEDAHSLFIALTGWQVVEKGLAKGVGATSVLVDWGFVCVPAFVVVLDVRGIRTTKTAKLFKTQSCHSTENKLK